MSKSDSSFDVIDNQALPVVVGLFCIFVVNTKDMALTLSGKVEWRGKQGGVLVNTITYIDTTDYVSEGINPANIIGIISVSHETQGIVYDNKSWESPDFIGNGSAVISALLNGSGNFVNGEYSFAIKVRDGINGFEYDYTKVVTLAYSTPIVSIEHTVDGYASTLKSEDKTNYTGFSVGAEYQHTVTLPQGGSSISRDSISVIGATIYAGVHTTTIVAPITYANGDITVYNEVVGSKSVTAYKLSKDYLWAKVSLLYEDYTRNIGTNPILALSQKDIALRCNVYQDEYEKALNEGSTIKAYTALLRIFNALYPLYVDAPTVEEIPVFIITPTTLHSHSNLSVLGKLEQVGGDLYFEGGLISVLNLGKAKMNMNDSLDYLDQKIDNISIQVSALDKLELVPSWISGKIDSTLSYNSGTSQIGISESYLQGRVQGDYIKFDDTTKKLYVDETALVQLINNTVGGVGGGESLWTDIVSYPTNQIGTEKSVIIGALTPTTHKLYVNGSVRIGSLNGILKASVGVVSAGALVASEIPNLDWSKITSGKPTTISGYGITDNHNFTNIPDTRDTVTTPNTYNRKFATSFKRTSTLSLSVGSTYAHVLGYRAYGDNTGGYAHELAFVNEGIYHRSGDTTTWNVAWDKLIQESEVYTRAHIDSTYYTKTNINNFFSGATAITGYNKTDWDSTYTLFNDLFEKKSDGQGGYYIRAKYTLASDGNIIAFTDSGQSLPSIFDNLPIASPSQLGVVKVGTSLTISGGVLNINGDIFNLTNYYTKTDVNNFFSGVTSIAGYNKSNWDTAYTERQQWSGTSTNLVAATGRASLDVAQKQSSVTDTTSGRGMIVGAFGLGGAGTGLGLSDNSYSRLFWTNIDTPTPDVHAGIKIIGSTDYSFDLAGRNDRFWLRTKENGTQQSWKEIYHTGNLIGNITTHYHQNIMSPLVSHEDEAVSDSTMVNVYRVGTTTTEGYDGYILASSWGGDDYKHQIYYDVDGTYTMALRTRVKGVWSPWKKIFNEANANLSTVDWAAKNIRVSGNASIGKTTVESGYILDTNGSVKVNGNLVATGDVIAYSSSDRRLKRDIKPIVNGLELVEQLNPVTYKWNNKAKSLFNADVNKNNFGLIAQELAEIIPELTGEMHGGESMGVNYTPIINILIAAVKELNKKMEELC